jgi:hypothetical protein
MPSNDAVREAFESFRPLRGMPLPAAPAWPIVKNAPAGLSR